MPHTDFRRVSLSERCSRRMSRSACSACVAYTFFISFCKRQRSSLEASPNCGSIPCNLQRRGLYKPISVEGVCLCHLCNLELVATEIPSLFFPLSRQPSNVVGVNIVHVQPLRSPPPSLWRRRREAVRHLLRGQSRYLSPIAAMYLQSANDVTYDTRLGVVSVLECMRSNFRLQVPPTPRGGTIRRPLLEPMTDGGDLYYV